MKDDEPIRFGSVEWFNHQITEDLEVCHEDLHEGFASALHNLALFLESQGHERDHYKLVELMGDAVGDLAHGMHHDALKPVNRDAGSPGRGVWYFRNMVKAALAVGLADRGERMRVANEASKRLSVSIDTLLNFRENLSRGRLKAPYGQAADCFARERDYIFGGPNPPDAQEAITQILNDLSPVEPIKIDEKP